MAEPLVAVEDEEENVAAMSRKEKRKEIKKKKRREKRRELAEKEREEEEARLNDPEELKRMALIEEDERLSMEKEKIEFEERERIWLEKIRKEDEEQEERRRKKSIDDSEIIKDDDNEEGSDWEYVEEGPAEIIWQGNEIIVKKKKVRVSKKNVEQHPIEEDTGRPTSNPLPPQSEVFSDYTNASTVSANEIYDNVAQQVPNFGTERDKSHCPFHIKTGACRFGQRCSRVHFYPDKSCTLLIKNMYNGPGLAWEQDEGLEYTDEEVELCYEEFYEDVHTEFLKFGEIVNFKVCKNGSFHLRGNVYVHYKSLDSAVLAYQYINGRYFAGKQVTCEYVGVTKWKIAICGEYMRSRLNTCSRGTACNFIHCFRNPSGDYEWADWDNTPPRYWVKKMTALFGYSDEYTPADTESLGRSRSSSQIIPADEYRRHLRRSKSSERDGSRSGFNRCHNEKNGQCNSPHSQKHVSDGRKRSKVRYEEKREDRTNCNDFHYYKGEFHDSDSDRSSDSRNTDRLDGRGKKRSRQSNHVLEFKNDYGDNRSRTLEADSDECISDVDMERDTCSGRSRKSSRHGKKENHYRRRKTSTDICYDKKKHSNVNKEVSELSDDFGENKNTIVETDRERAFSEKKKVNETHHERSRKSTNRHRGSRDLKDDGGTRKRGHDTDSGGDWSDRDRGSTKPLTSKRKRKRSTRWNDISGLPDNHGESKIKIESVKQHDQVQHLT